MIKLRVKAIIGFLFLLIIGCVTPSRVQPANDNSCIDWYAGWAYKHYESKYTFEQTIEEIEKLGYKAKENVKHYKNDTWYNPEIKIFDHGLDTKEEPIHYISIAVFDERKLLVFQGICLNERLKRPIKLKRLRELEDVIFKNILTNIIVE